MEIKTYKRIKSTKKLRKMLGIKGKLFWKIKASSTDNGYCVTSEYSILGKCFIPILALLNACIEFAMTFASEIADAPKKINYCREDYNKTLYDEIKGLTK